MTKDIELNLAIERAELLVRKRKHILSLSPEKSIDLILEEKFPAALVHSFPEEDFHFLIHEIGVEDSLELLSLASNRQWEYILDIETWEKDQIQIKSLTRWLKIFLLADSKRLIQWFLEEKAEVMEFYLSKNIELFIREHDQPPDFGDNVFTLDDVFYIKPLDNADVEESETTGEDNEEFLVDLLQRIADHDHRTYQNILMESSTIIPAETEEEAYRLRNVRLAEKGFIPFDEAIGIYKPIKPKDIKRAGVKVTYRKGRQDDYLPVPLYSTGMLKDNNLFTHALKSIEDDQVIRQLQVEFAGLCNLIISADQKIIRGKNELGTMVDKAAGYVSIGLERLTEKEQDTIHHSSLMIQQFPLSHIFKVGYGLALNLKWKAQKWRKESWYAKEKLPLSFWGEEWMGVIGGLLIKKPLFYANYKNGMLYREFAALADIAETKKILDEVIAFDHMLSLMTINLQSISSRLLTYKNLVLTLWARRYLSLSDELLPIKCEEFKSFFNELLPSNHKPRKPGISMKESFLKWLSARSGINAIEISETLGHSLEHLFVEIESEYGEVSDKNLDPKHIHLFLLS